MLVVPQLTAFLLIIDADENDSMVPVNERDHDEADQEEEEYVDEEEEEDDEDALVLEDDDDENDDQEAEEQDRQFSGDRFITKLNSISV